MNNPLGGARTSVSLRAAPATTLLLFRASASLSQTSPGGRQSASENATTGYLTPPDGVRRYYAKIGSGPQVVIMPGRRFALPAFLRHAQSRPSDGAADNSKISLQHVV